MDDSARKAIARNQAAADFMAGRIPAEEYRRIIEENQIDYVKGVKALAKKRLEKKPVGSSMVERVKRQIASFIFTHFKRS